MVDSEDTEFTCAKTVLPCQIKVGLLSSMFCWIRMFQLWSVKQNHLRILLWTRRLFNFLTTSTLIVPEIFIYSPNHGIATSRTELYPWWNAWNFRRNFRRNMLLHCRGYQASISRQLGKKSSKEPTFNVSRSMVSLLRGVLAKNNWSSQLIRELEANHSHGINQARILRTQYWAKTLTGSHDLGVVG